MRPDCRKADEGQGEARLVHRRRRGPHRPGVRHRVRVALGAEGHLPSGSFEPDDAMHVHDAVKPGGSEEHHVTDREGRSGNSLRGHDAADGEARPHAARQDRLDQPATRGDLGHAEPGEQHEGEGRAQPEGARGPRAPGTASPGSRAGGHRPHPSSSEHRMGARAQSFCTRWAARGRCSPTPREPHRYGQRAPPAPADASFVLSRTRPAPSRSATARMPGCWSRRSRPRRRTVR